MANKNSRTLSSSNYHHDAASVRNRRRQKQLTKHVDFFMTVIEYSGFIICFVLFLVQGKNCIDRYNSHDISVNVQVQSTSPATFPAFTICPAYGTGYNASFLSSYGFDVYNYSNLGLYPNNNNNNIPPNVTLSEFFDEATMTLDEMLDYVVVTTFDGGDNHTFSYTIYPNDSTGGVWKRHRYYYYGSCFTMTIPEAMTSLVVSCVEFFSIGSPYVYIHHPGQFLSSESQFSLSPLAGKTVGIAVNFELISLMENTDPDFGYACSEETDFGFDQCLYEALADLFVKEFGCVSPFQPGNGEGNASYPVCDIPSMNDTQQENLQSTFINYLENRQNELCPDPCSTTNLFSTAPYMDGLYEADSNASYLEVYFMRNTKSTTTILSYTTLSLVADIGGYMALLLGFSIYDLTKLFGKAIRESCLRKVESWRK